MIALVFILDFVNFDIRAITKSIIMAFDMNNSYVITIGHTLLIQGYKIKTLAWLMLSNTITDKRYKVSWKNTYE